MTRRIAALALAGFWLALAGGGAACANAPLLPPLFDDHAPQPSLVFAYHGWRVNALPTARLRRATTTVRAIKAQIDLVEHLNLPPRVLDFMRSTPIAAELGAPDERGRYLRGRGVVLNMRGLDDKRPALLEQLLYAYEDQVLPGGFANPDIGRLRREAAALHVWPNAAAMLHSDADYFAMVASAYLYGAITREPYTRADLHKTQPNAYRWLAGLFDNGVGRPDKPAG